jgi:hypothetical protein
MLEADWIFLGERIVRTKSFSCQGYTGDDREGILGRTERIFCRRQTERSCLSGPDWTAPRDAVVRKRVLKEDWIFCRKAERFLSRDRLKMSRKEIDDGNGESCNNS